MVREGENVTIQVGNGSAVKPVYPKDIVTMRIMELKNTAEAYPGRTVDQVVLSVPPNYTPDQLQAIRTAASKAGLLVFLRTEQIATGIAYGFETREGERNILVFDLGGTSLDITVMDIEYGVFDTWATTSIAIGGKDFD
jgi:molecular chaperone DnaK (HSP70)